MATSKCERCGREGTRGFVKRAGGPVCEAEKACDERREHEERKHGLWFSADRQRYTLDGERVPGVTTLIKNGIPTPALVPWATNTVARYGAEHLDELWGMRGLGTEAIFQTLRQAPNSARDSAGARGSQLHKWAEELLATGTVQGISDALLPWVRSVADFIEDYQPTAVLTEAPVGSRRWRYAGTLDLVADFPDGRRRILDWKSSKRIYSEIALQLAGYKHADFCLVEREEIPLDSMGISDEGYAVLIRPEGYKVHPVYIGEEVHQAFLRTKWMSDLTRDGGPLDSWLGQPLPPRPGRNNA